MKFWLLSSELDHKADVLTIILISAPDEKKARNLAYVVTGYNQWLDKEQSDCEPLPEHDTNGRCAVIGVNENQGENGTLWTMKTKEKTAHCGLWDYK